MIDFSSVKSVSIPEGGVAKIRDAVGNTLWQKADEVSMATVTLSNTVQTSYQMVVVSGVELTQEGQSVRVPIGTAIEIYGQYGIWEVFGEGDSRQVGTFSSTDKPVEYTVQYDIWVSWSSNGVVAINHHA